MTLPEAVLQIDGQAAIAPPVSSRKLEAAEPKKLLLPKKNENNNRVVNYLLGRGIQITLIDYCLDTGRLYESQPYHNAVFIGFDRKGTPKYATLRGTTNRRYMGEANGSDKHFSFSIPSREESHRLHLFESAIDLLSYGTLELLSTKDWRQENCLSLAGIYKPKKIIEESTPPAALMQYLKDFPYINDIALHLDNDIAGRLAAKTIQTILPLSYTVAYEPPKRGKDYNDYLKMTITKNPLHER